MVRPLRSVLLLLLLYGVTPSCRFNASGIPLADATVDAPRRWDVVHDDGGDRDEGTAPPDAPLGTDGPPDYTCSNPTCESSQVCCKLEPTDQPRCEKNNSNHCLCNVQTEKPCRPPFTCCAQGDAIPRCYDSAEAQDCL
jgi:hypothetical protein